MFTGIVEDTGTVAAAEPRGDVLSVRIDVDDGLRGSGPGRLRSP